MKDCTNITDFFSRRNVAVMTTKELFEFVTDLALRDDQVDNYLNTVIFLEFS